MSQPLEERRFTQPRRQVVAMLVGALALFAIGVWMIRADNWLGWIVVGFFGLAAVVLALMVWRPTSVVLSEAGISIQTLVRSNHYHWHDITNMGIWEQKQFGITANRLVTFDIANPSSAMATAARTVGSGHVTLPPVGVKADELLQIAHQYWLDSK